MPHLVCSRPCGSSGLGQQPRSRRLLLTTGVTDLRPGSRQPEQRHRPPARIPVCSSTAVDDKHALPACLPVSPLCMQDREGEGSKADSTFSSGLLTPNNPVAPGSPNARPGSPNLLAMLLQTSYQPLVPGGWGPVCFLGLESSHTTHVWVMHASSCAGCRPFSLAQAAQPDRSPARSACRAKASLLTLPPIAPSTSTCCCCCWARCWTVAARQ